MCFQINDMNGSMRHTLLQNGDFTSVGKYISHRVTPDVSKADVYHFSHQVRHRCDKFLSTSGSQSPM